MKKWKPVNGFIPGKHCTDVSHHIANELAELPPVLFKGPDGKDMFVCSNCAQKTYRGIKRSMDAKRGVETRRRNGGKRAPRPLDKRYG